MVILLQLIAYLKSCWKPLLIGFISAAIWWHGYDHGAGSIQRKWDTANVAAIVTARETEHNNAIFSNQIGEKYEISLLTIDDSYRTALAGLYQPTSNNLSNATNPSSKPDATTCSNQFYKANKQAILELARQAEINTQRLVALQEWVSSTSK